MFSLVSTGEGAKYLRPKIALSHGLVLGRNVQTFPTLQAEKIRLLREVHATVEEEDDRLWLVVWNEQVFWNHQSTVVGDRYLITANAEVTLLGTIGWYTFRVEEEKPPTLPPVLELYKCSICFELFVHTTLTPCGHAFCKPCITPCLRRPCPLCRQEVRQVTPCSLADETIRMLLTTNPAELEKWEGRMHS